MALIVFVIGWAVFAFIAMALIVGPRDVLHGITDTANDLRRYPAYLLRKVLHHD